MASTSDRPSASPNGSSTTPKTTAAKHRGSSSGASGGIGADGDTGAPYLSSAMSPAPRISPPGSVSASAANSTLSSREPSPVRVTPRVSNNNLKSATRASRNHKNSPSPSPNRGSASVAVPSSAAAVQNAFSQLNKPDFQQPVSVDPSLDVPGPEKTNMPPPPARSSDSNRVPSSASRRRSSITSNAPRSPGPRNASKRSEPESTPANISTKRSSPSAPSEEDVLSPTKINTDDSDAALRRGSARGPSGGTSTLETVEEASLPSTPMTDRTTKSRTDEAKIDEAAKQTAESGSESGGNRSSGSKEDSRPKAVLCRPPGDVLPKRSFTSLNSARAKPGDGSVRNMIVETETVTSIPQVSLGVGPGERGGSSRNDQGGTIRVKQSMETIRPKKEKKKTTRKATGITGTASSKADIFEAKVASAVDEADVSDSDETFVYESNPPDPHPGRQHRYHSRTPSTASMASQADQFVGRSRSGLRDGAGVTGKRSMKFTNNYAGLDGDTGDLDQGRGSGRGDSNGHSSRHHHIGRHGRGGAYPSLFDSDSPFPQSQSQPSRSSRHYISNGYRQNRRGNNARGYQNYRTIVGPKNMGDAYAEDFDGDGADDERTPLVGSGRILRSRNGRRPNSASLRQMEYLEHRQLSCFSRYGGCVIAAFLVLLLIGGAATFLVALTKPLLDVHVTKISNVLASEQEIMLDLNVDAINPNIFPIAIGSMDVDIFARSRFVSSDKFWREDGHADDFPRVERSRRRAELAQVVRRTMSPITISPSDEVHTTDGVDKGTDPIPEDPSGDAKKMLLGRVFEFDSPLIFEPAPWTRLPSSASGGIRLARPGNKTAEGGTERWERVLQHPFELIVRGVVKYSLPLSSGVRSAQISSTVQVLPDQDGDGDDDGPHNDTVRINRPTLISTKIGTPIPVTESSYPVVVGRMFSS